MFSAVKSVDIKLDSWRGGLGVTTNRNRVSFENVLKLDYGDVSITL